SSPLKNKLNTDEKGTIIDCRRADMLNIVCTAQSGTAMAVRLAHTEIAGIGIIRSNIQLTLCVQFWFGRYRADGYRWQGDQERLGDRAEIQHGFGLVQRSALHGRVFRGSRHRRR